MSEPDQFQHGTTTGPKIKARIADLGGTALALSPAAAGTEHMIARSLDAALDVLWRRGFLARKLV